jgi:hypothetical protein
MKLEILTYFRKILKQNISRKSVQWELSFLCGQTDGETDMAKLIVAFGNFANAPKTVISPKYLRLPPDGPPVHSVLHDAITLRMCADFAQYASPSMRRKAGTQRRQSSILDMSNRTLR